MIGSRALKWAAMKKVQSRPTVVAIAVKHGQLGGLGRSTMVAVTAKVLTTLLITLQVEF